jgi:hypothetical protein
MRNIIFFAARVKDIYMLYGTVQVPVGTVILLIIVHPEPKAKTADPDPRTLNLQL